MSTLTRCHLGVHSYNSLQNIILQVHCLLPECFRYLDLVKLQSLPSRLGCISPGLQVHFFLSLEFAGISSVNTCHSIHGPWILKRDNSHQKLSSVFWGSGCMFFSEDSSHLCWNLHCMSQVAAGLGSSLVLHNQTFGLCIYSVSVLYSVLLEFEITMLSMHADTSIGITTCILKVSLKTDVIMAHT